MRQINSMFNKALASSGIKKNQQQFLWMVCVILLVIGSIKYYKTEDLNLIMVSIIPPLVVISFVAPMIVKGPLVIWYAFSLILSEVTSTLFLGVIYFTIITLIKALTKKKNVSQNWVKRDKINNFDEMY